MTGVVQARLDAEAAAWRAGTDRLAAGDLDAEVVHQVRLASRRLRSTLATYGDLVIGDRADPLRRELGWFAGLLGALRDPTVARDRLDGLLESEAAVPASVIATVDARYQALADGAGVTVQAAFGSVRFADLQQAVASFEGADLPEVSAHELATRALHEWLRLAPLAAVVDDSERRDLALHDVRKAAKRLYDALVTIAPEHPEADLWAHRLARLVGLLGRRQDAVVSRGQLRVMAASMAEDAEAAFAFGRLDAQEEARLTVLDARWPDEWRRATRPKLRRWLG